jgi:hypothetical protein
MKPHCVRKGQPTRIPAICGNKTGNHKLKFVMAIKESLLTMGTEITACSSLKLAGNVYG